MTRFRWLWLILAAVAVVATTGAGQREPFTISFHRQGEKHEGTFVRADPENPSLYFRVNPDITHHQMTSFTPFPGDDGTTFGAVFTLTGAGQQRLATLATEGEGRLLRSVVNGRPVDYLQIDRAGLRGAEIVIWKGITKKEMKKFEKKLRRRSLNDRIR